MRYYLDTEFYEDGRTIDLISIALVREDGSELYAVNQEARLDLVSGWVRKNVLTGLPLYSDPAWQTRASIQDLITSFLADDPAPRFWAWYADYDWVVFCQLFGTMMSLPRHFPKFCFDLKQLAVEKGNPRLPEQVSTKHNALLDAHWNRAIHQILDPRLKGTP